MLSPRKKPFGVGSAARGISHPRAWTQPHDCAPRSCPPSSRDGPAVFPAVGLVQGLGGRGHAVGQATRAEGSTSGVCLRPSKTRTGPGAERGPTRQRGGRPASPRSSGARTRGAVGVGQVGEPRISAQTGKGLRRRPAWTPLGGGLWRGAAEEKRKQFGNSPSPDRGGEEGLPCSTGPSPSWPRPPRLGRP